MSNKAKRISMGISIVFALITIAEACYMFFKPSHFKVFVPIIVIVGAVLLSLMCLFGLYKRKDFFFKLGIVGGFLGAVGVGLYLGMALTGITAMLGNETNLKEMIKKAGIWGPIVYIFIQFAQVTLVPIPSTVTILAGTMVFSLVEVLLYSTIGLVLGSMFAFALGKIFGVKLVVWIVGEKAFNKYQKIIKGRDKTMLFLMFLFPVFPDDLLCLIAGITTMNYTTFFIMQLITRPLGIMMSSLSGELIKNIPFTGWYLAVWAALGIGVVVMFICVWKYSGKIEAKLIKVMTSRFSTKTISTVDIDSLKANVKNLVSDARVILESDIQDNNKGRTYAPRKPKFIVNYRD